MDIPLVLARLCPTANWGPAAQSHATYEQFAARWEDKALPCPSKDAMLAAWVTIQNEQTAEKTENQQAKELISNFMNAPNGTATAAQRDAVIKAIIRRMRTLEER